MLPLDEAQARLLEGAAPLGTETLPVAACRGRYLATDCVASRTQPPADVSAMDGYAMRGDDLAGPWRVVGESAAGHPYSGALATGEAVRISTGAFVPDDAGAVLLQENATRDGDTLSLNGEGVPTSHHIRRKGFDFSTGNVVLERGGPVGAGQIALAMSAGNASLDVGRLPRITIIDSGDELGADPAALAPHQIPASNGAMLAAMAAPFAGVVERVGPVPDRLEAIVEAFEHAGDADVIVTSGGASVGDHDLLRPALEQWGAGLAFWKVAMKPGKPLLVARRGRQIVLGLPGNPVSSYVTAFLFLLPLLRRLGGAASALPVSVELTLGGPLPATGKRVELVRAVKDGGMVTPLGQQDSSGLLALARANALIRREIGSPEAAKDERVAVYLLENGGVC